MGGRPPEVCGNEGVDHVDDVGDLRKTAAEPLERRRCGPTDRPGTAAGRGAQEPLEVGEVALVGRTVGDGARQTSDRSPKSATSLPLTDNPWFRVVTAKTKLRAHYQHVVIGVLMSHPVLVQAGADVPVYSRKSP